ncbi:VQ motif-containing protein 1-like [Ipomoea triloba]|uniref:VQ motif-containing protein 1-like n=1 Tax=Ipomoea triloba TaxID=35885 RepID=UPI00125DC2BA|nr:VQ motif-containing protein 1-like [Ipomoea triloba]
MSRGGSNNGGAGRPLKVVIINTQYVETDARSFKSVVQRLTGKDSTAADIKKEHHYSGGMAAASNPPLSRGLSFKDFDKLFKELPPVDELYRAIY